MTDLGQIVHINVAVLYNGKISYLQKPSVAIDMTVLKPVIVPK